jgi:uncharacterized RDD family membrane protein YckC
MSSARGSGAGPGSGQQYGYGPQGGSSGQQYGYGPPAGSASPVPAEETRVTGRRVVQYIIDGVLASIIPYILYWALDRGTGGTRVLGLVAAAVLSVLFYFWYWVIRPHGADGQTFGMKWLGLRVISKDGGPATIAQLAIRWILLIIDDLIAGLVGLFTMLFSHDRQRVGDHAAKTLVVRAHWQPGLAAWQSTDATRAGPAGGAR